jgi:hypothetical protein
MGGECPGPLYYVDYLSFVRWVETKAALRNCLQRASKAAEHSTHTRPGSPPELQAPITSKIEQQLGQLIRQFGAETVRARAASNKMQMGRLAVRFKRH